MIIEIYDRFMNAVQPTQDVAPTSPMGIIEFQKKNAEIFLAIRESASDEYGSINQSFAMS